MLATTLYALQEGDPEACARDSTLAGRLFCEMQVSNSCGTAYQDYAQAFQIISSQNKVACMAISSHTLRELCLSISFEAFDALRLGAALPDLPTTRAVLGATP